MGVNPSGDFVKWKRFDFVIAFGGELGFLVHWLNFAE